MCMAFWHWLRGWLVPIFLSALLFMQVTGLALFGSGQLHSRVEGSSCKIVLLSWFFKSLIARENVWGLLGRGKEMRVDFGESYISKRDQKTLSIALHPTLPSTRLGARERDLLEALRQLTHGSQFVLCIYLFVTPGIPLLGIQFPLSFPRPMTLAHLINKHIAWFLCFW